MLIPFNTDSRPFIKKVCIVLENTRNLQISLFRIDFEHIRKNNQVFFSFSYERDALPFQAGLFIVRYWRKKHTEHGNSLICTDI